MTNAKPWPSGTPNAKWSASSAADTNDGPPRSIAALNRRPEAEKRAIYADLIPGELIALFDLPPDLRAADGQDLLRLVCPAGSPGFELALYHPLQPRDPLCYGQVCDTVTGQVHVLLYTLNDPRAPRFDVDCLPDGRSTRFGTECRNLPAEQAALLAGLAPGQARRGMRLLGAVVRQFEAFVARLGQSLYFAEPLYYHNAVIFERYGFRYERGRRLMERIQAGFELGGDLAARLDCSTPFRQPEAAGSIRLRSWAIHDGLLGEPFHDVTMYKIISQPAQVNTCPGCEW